MTNALKTYLQNLDLPLKEVDEIITHFNPLTLSAGDHFLLQGKTPDVVAFIAEGIMRLYQVDENANDITRYFLSENSFFVSLVKQPSWCNIQAITLCQLLVMKHDEFNTLLERFPNLAKAVDKLQKQGMAEKIKSRGILQKTTAASRYEYFIQTHQDIALRVPLQYIASYIGITPQSLSRVRRQYKNNLV